MLENMTFSVAIQEKTQTESHNRINHPPAPTPRKQVNPTSLIN